uniref:Uncharacterized protein n=1 Tax=Ficedula albicollis TaxID=59894 RepID=A0A803VKF5_FICAL
MGPWEDWKEKLGKIWVPGRIGGKKWGRNWSLGGLEGKIWENLGKNQFPAGLEGKIWENWGRNWCLGGLEGKICENLGRNRGDSTSFWGWSGRGLVGGDETQIVGNLRVKEISVERISLDYPSPGQAQLSEGDLGHVTEIYDFPSSLKTQELLAPSFDFLGGSFQQFLFLAASQALGRRYPCLKIRPLIHASKQSKIKALQRPKLLQLGKERPQTDTAVARRLVSHALGWRHRQQEATGNEDFQPEPLDQEE